MPNLALARLVRAFLFTREGIMLAAKANPDALLTGAQAARAVGVSRQLINAWREKGWLTQQSDGKYRYADVVEIERRTRRSVHSSRKLRLA